MTDVQQMRAAQRTCFKTWQRAEFALSNTLKATVDKALAARFAKHGNLI